MGETVSLSNGAIHATDNGGANGHTFPNANANQRGSREAAAPSVSRFNEADLDLVASLVGLETLTSTEEHCGSRSLYMFEQLTALDRSAIAAV